MCYYNSISIQMKSIKILAINIVLKKLCLNLFKTLSNINPPIHYLMNNKSNSIQKRRIWTDIAQDIGYVLRKQMLNQQILSRSQKKHQISSHAIAKSLFENSKIATATQQNRNTKVYFIRGNTRSLSKKVEPHKYPKISNLKSIKKMYDEDQERSTLIDVSRGKLLSQQKRREAQMLKSFLHKLKVQNNVKKIHNLREKSYKVWKLRITNSAKKNQMLTSEQHYP